MGREPAVPSGLLVGLHVLVVDDSHDTRELFRTILEYGGALVTVAVSAEQALRMVSHIVPDVLITDIAMPVNDGFWLIAELRARDAAAGGALPAIAVSAHAEPRAGRFLAAGFQAYLRKPVDPWELCRLVESLGRPRR